MTDVIVVGGGPAGLSAALFCAKNDLETVVFDTGKTWLQHAHLFNYLGIRSMDGDIFHERAKNHAVDDHGAIINEDEEVTAIEQSGDGDGDDAGFTVETAEDSYEADYVVLATGSNRDLAESAGCAFDGDVVAVDVTMETSVPNLYATGAMVREEEWQAIISAGDGAAAALNILSNEKGEHFHDFDTPDDV